MPQLVESGVVPGRVLVVDDEPLVLSMLRRVLESRGYSVQAVTSAEAALLELARAEYDVVISDVQLPKASGVELLRFVRGRDLDLPVVLMTGRPTLHSAVDAVELAAFRYLLKPVEPEDLVLVVEEAMRTRSFARAIDPARGRRQLEATFRKALGSLWIAFQPVLSTDRRETIGYEALLRSREDALPDPGAIVDAAEKLGTVHMLGRTVRARTAAAIDASQDRCTFFVNLHPADLADAELYEAGAPLTRHARQVVLELTERSTLEGTPGLDARLDALRSLGYRIAIDDLGAGYAGMSYFASLRPDVVKLDISLVREIDRDPVKQKVVLALTGLGRSMGIEVVGEGVETPGERDTLTALGCDYLQGFLFGRPAPPFARASWGDDGGR